MRHKFRRALLAIVTLILVISVNIVLNPVVAFNSLGNKVSVKLSDTQPGEYTNFSPGYIDLFDFGKLNYEVSSKINVPETIRFNYNDASANVKLKVEHQIDELILPPHMILDLDIASIEETLFRTRGNKDAVAAVALTFDGILFKGVPEYLSKTPWVKENDFSLIQYPESDSKAALVKLIKAPPEIVDHFKGIQQRLDTIKRESEGLSSIPSGLDSEAKLLLEEKAKILSQIMGNFFPCGPDFERDIKFPITEYRASSNGNNAGAGVSGDVYIHVHTPQCKIVTQPPFDLKGEVYTDVDILSHGYVGARVEGSTGVAVATFKEKYKGKYEEYPINVTFTEEERKAFNRLVIKALDKSRNVPEIIAATTQRVQNAIPTIQQAIMQASSSSINANPCKYISGLNPPNDIKSTCKFISVVPKLTLPIKPTLPSRPQLPKRPPGVCGKYSPAYVCKAIRNWENKVNSLLDNWEKNKNTLLSNWEKKKKSLTAKYNAEVKKRANNINKVAQFVSKNYNTLLPQVDVSGVANLLLDAAWKGYDLVDLTSKFVPSSLGVTVQGSARAAFTARAHILHARPKLIGNLSLNQNSLSIYAGAIQDWYDLDNRANITNNKAQPGGIGGLDVLGFTLNANAIVKANGKTISKPSLSVNEFTPTLDPGKIILSNQEIPILTNTFHYQ